MAAGRCVLVGILIMLALFWWYGLALMGEPSSVWFWRDVLGVL